MKSEQIALRLHPWLVDSAPATTVRLADGSEMPSHLFDSRYQTPADPETAEAIEGDELARLRSIADMALAHRRAFAIVAGQYAGHWEKLLNAMGRADCPLFDLRYHLSNLLKFETDVYQIEIGEPGSPNYVEKTPRGPFADGTILGILTQLWTGIDPAHPNAVRITEARKAFEAESLRLLAEAASQPLPATVDTEAQ